MQDALMAKSILKIWRRRCGCRRVHAERAPPPQDVYWENLEHRTSILKLLFLSATGLFAALVGVGLYYAQEQKETSGILLGMLLSAIIFTADKVG